MTSLRQSPVIVALVALMGLVAFAPDDAGASDDERRALWVVRDALLSPAAIERMVAEAERGRITDLFVQVRGRGDAYYRSDLVPAAAPLRDAWRKYGDYDPLDYALTLAHDRGIRVHAWMNAYLVASTRKLPEGHVVRQHPEWIATAASGRRMTDFSQKELARELTEGIYLDAGNPEVVRHLVAVVTEVATNYPVDGIHLDYVRYPHLDTGYSETMRATFRKRAGVDPLEFEGNRKGLLRERGATGFADLQEEWGRFRARQVTAFVSGLRQELRLTRPGLFLSAAVKPDVEAAHIGYGQDWVRWIERDYVDVVAPMMYSTKTADIRRQSRLIARSVPAEQVWAGIAVYNQSVGSAEAKIREVRKAGMGGIAVFSYNALRDGSKDLRRLTAR